MSRELEVLTCTKCGAPIPFGDAATIACPFCKTANEVPEAYREMRAANQLDAASRTEAELLLKKLDRPPLLITKVIARMFDFNFLGFLMAYGIPVALWIIVGGLHVADLVAPKLGYKNGDAMPFGITVAIMFTIVFVVIFIPRVFGIYANRRVSGRMRVLNALAAKPPKTEGGPAQCRHCGAPLAVEPGALLAVCAYCATQNAVELRTTLVAAAGKIAHELAASVKEAAAHDRDERRRTRRLLLRELVWYVSLLTFYAFAFATFEVKVLGPIMIVLASLLLIAMPFVSALRFGLSEKDATSRRAGNDVPGWVAALGPLIVWYAFVKLPIGC